jgi:hypothetical protein
MLPFLPCFLALLTHKQVHVLPSFSHLTNLLFPLTTTWTIVCMPAVDPVPAWTDHLLHVFSIAHTASFILSLHFST